ncbi:hypothetical protein CF328_g7510 [Tilletia controversa]|nr:hypothetical protein CF328_g7510 [Tilletia controversa]
MDLYARFDLPPPPPPTFLSRDHGASRARFPEFQTAAELRDFIRAMTVWYLPSWILVTIRLTIVLLSVYLVLCFIVILKSFRRRSPWVLRFGEGEKRSLVVPHAHNCWTVCCMLYYCLVLACMCGSLFSIEKQEPVLHVPFWAICICMPVALGGWIQIWGFIVAAVPRRLTGALTSHKISARVLNAICFGLPPLAFILLIVPTAISDHYWHRVVTKEWPAFRDRYLDETELSHEMLVDAQKIWNSLLRSSLMLSIACIAWFIIGTALASLYTGVVWRTVRSLQDFLATQEAIHGRTNASSTSTGSASRPQFWPFSKKHTESSTAQKNPVPVPVWRPEDSSETMINMGHQHARHVLTCFIGGILVGGIGMLVLAVGIAATLYPSMEQQTRAPRAAVLPIAAAVLGYVTLVFGAVNLISVAYSSFEAPFTDLLKANVSATESLLPRNAGSIVVNNE